MFFVDLDQRTPEWLSWRWMGITATESAVILGRSPYKTPWRLWCEKTGRARPPDLSANLQVRYGRENEDRVRQMFQLQHAEVLLPLCAECSEDRLFRASFDGLTSNDEPVEIKCPGSETMTDVKERGRESDAFRLYNIQVQHQLLVAGARHGWLVFYDGETNDLTEFEIDRDNDLIAEIRKTGRAFWDLVIQDKEPKKDLQRDFYVPKTDDEISQWCRLAADYVSAAREVDDLKAQIEGLNAVRTRCKEQLSRLMGDYRCADFAGVALTRRAAVSSVDYEKLCRAKGITSEELNGFRKEAKESWLIRSTGSPMPKDFIDETMEDCLTAADRSEPMWF